MSGHKNRLELRVGIKIEFISLMVSKFTCFLYEGSKLTLGCSVGILLDLFFVLGSKSTSVLSAGQKSLGSI